MTVTRQDVQAAAQRIEGRVRRTPLWQASADASLWLKLEHLQHCGVFKTRGAFNRQLAGVEAGEILEDEPSIGTIVVAVEPVRCRTLHRAVEVGRPDDGSIRPTYGPQRLNSGPSAVRS